MFKHVLIATDGSELAQKAVAHGFALAKALEARVTVVTVTDIYPTGPYSPIPLPSMIEHYEAAAALSAANILSSVSDVATKRGVSCATMHVKDQTPAQGILDAARQHACDLIVIASHGRRGMARLLLGSQAQKVMTLSTLPVLICR
jgi:nucleotide-binding universal stress UspA family protein